MCKVQNNTSVSKSADRGGGEAGRSSQAIAQSQLIETSMHPAAATQSKFCELGSLVMPRWPKTMAGVEKRGLEEMRNTLTVRPGACLGGMAGQCPRGRLDATRGGLHRGTTGSTAPGASTGVQPHQDPLGEAPQASERSRRGMELSGGRGVKSRAGSNHGSPRRGGGRRNYLVEVEEGTEASVSPKGRRRRSPDLAGVARRRRRRSRSPEGSKGREESEWGLG
jgi:hypothetical protein